MGICIHCMQAKPITANKCPYCHERTGVLESLWWTAFISVGKWVGTFLIFYLLFQCTSSAAP